MLLCGPEAKGSHLLYSMGKANRFYYQWWTASSHQQELWRADILKTNADIQSRGWPSEAGAQAGAIIAAKADAILARLIAHVQCTNPDFDYEQWIDEVKAAKGARSTSNPHVSEHRKLTWDVAGKEKWGDVKRDMKKAKNYPPAPETGSTKGHELRKAAAREARAVFEVEYLIAHKAVFTELYHRHSNKK
jgi:hypothetical protein